MNACLLVIEVFGCRLNDDVFSKLRSTKSTSRAIHHLFTDYIAGTSWKSLSQIGFFHLFIFKQGGGFVG